MQTDVKESGMLERAGQWWSSLPSAPRIYLVGLSVFLVSLALFLHDPKSLASNVSFTAAMICLGSGFLREGYGWAVLRKDYPLVKIAGGIVTVMAAAVATGAAAITLADATGQDPANFRSSITLLAPLAFVPVLALLIMLVAAMSLPIVLMVTAGKLVQKKQQKDPLETLLILARILGAVALVAGAGQLLRPSTSLDNGLKDVAGYSAYLLDMHDDLSCSNVPGDRITRINDNLVILGRLTDEGPRFARIVCVLGPEATVLPPPRSSSQKTRAT